MKINIEDTMSKNTDEPNHEELKQKIIIRELPVLPTRGVVLFPHMVVPWTVDKPNLIKLVDDVVASDRTIAVLHTNEDEGGKPVFAGMGTMGIILRMAKGDEGQAKLLVQSMSRVKVLEFTSFEPYIKARCEIVNDIANTELETQALTVNVRQVFSRILELSPNLPNELVGLIANVDDPGTLADVVISYLNVPVNEKISVLESLDIKDRLSRTFNILARQLDILELGHKIQTQVKDQVDKTQKEYFLREQLKIIKKELGETDAEPNELAELREKVNSKGLPEEALKETNRELDRLARMHPASAEYTVAHTYIDWMLNLPWNEFTEDHVDIDKAEKILNEDHYDMEKVKKRILEYLAVRRLKPDVKGQILCFSGPPGTGKTSLGRSIARAMGRKFHRIALGGMRDEAEIRGHRRTYVGSMPGRIIQGLRKVGVKNPVFMLDEIDKIGSDFRGDPSSALLEVLDPEQNATFTDHYLGVEFDLSQVFFIATANVLDTIASPLLDRLELIELSGYPLEEKVEIARRYLVPRQLEAHGLGSQQLVFEKTAIEKIISDYTREAGVRNLERKIAAVCRSVAKEIAGGNSKKTRLRASNVAQCLGPRKFESEVAERTQVPGVATGLAWTPVGGEILFIEATKMKGAGKLTLTGKLGDVMKESAQTAFSYIKAKAEQLDLKDEMFKDEDIHLHVPAGAIPKDGPSAGVAMVASLLSLLKDTSVRSAVAMTGEISLRGLVLPVGGIKEKVLAAHRAGIKEVVLPKRNSYDLEDIPEDVKKTMVFHLVSRLDEAMKVVFGKDMFTESDREKNAA